LSVSACLQRRTSAAFSLSCRGLNPEAYLAEVLCRISDHAIKRIDELLPWHWQPIPQHHSHAA